MKKLIWLSLLLLLLLSAFLIDRKSIKISGNPDEIQLDSFRLVSKHVDENERCFRCHNKKVSTSETGETTGQDSIKLEEHQVITRREFYESNHKSLACLGCHADPIPGSPDRATKQAAESRTCNDCHQYIKEHARFHFAEIDEEFRQSVHYQKKQPEFTCWKCHNPHIFRTVYRNDENMSLAVSYDNAICLSCHKESFSSSGSGGLEMKDVMEMHKWLPEAEEHFKGIRCIDCHTKINTEVLVAHLVLPKEDGVRKCSECHSQNSILITTLYKNQPRDSSQNNVLFNSVVKKNIYVMGANRSAALNKICLSLLGLIICGIFVHAIPRILIKQKS